MRIPVPIVLAFTAVLAACSSSPATDEQPKGRPNDPLSELSASQIYIQKGVHYMEEGLYDVALKDLTRAVEIDSDNPDAYNALGVLYQKLDDAPHADASFKKAIALKPDNYAARNNYGRFLCTQGRAPEAFDQFQKVIGNKLYSQPWIPLTNAGVCANMAGKKTEAEAYLRQALDIEPNFPPALLEMAKLNRGGGQFMSARAFLERYFSVAGASPESLQLGIEIETALGNEDAAAQYAQRLRRMRIVAPRPPQAAAGNRGGASP